MKKIFIITAILVSIPAYAVCSIDTLSNSNVCSLPNVLDKTPSIFQHKDSEANLKPAEQLQPGKTQNTFEQFRQPNNEGLKYNSGCQFGNCVNDVNNLNNKSQ